MEQADLSDREGYTARPEDLIISKMLYYREGGSEKHLRDITGMLKVSAEPKVKAIASFLINSPLSVVPNAR